MSKSKMMTLGLALLIAAPASALLAPTLDEGFKPSDHETLGKLFASYFKALGDGKGQDKANDEIVKALAEIKKRIKRDPLSSSADIGKALWSQFAYDKSVNNLVKRGKVDTRDFPAYEKSKLSYAIWTPAKYNPKMAYPLILCMVGKPDKSEKGEKATDYITEKWQDAAIRDNAIVATVPMPEKEESWAAIVDGPEESGAGNLLRTLRHVTTNYAVDFDRIFLCGQGKASEAALALVARYPDRFAGMIGRAGDATDVQVENLRNLPTFFAGAGAKATALSETLDKLGYKNCTLKPEGKEADIWAWMQEHPRVSNPTEVVLYPGPRVPVSAYWLDVVPTDAPLMYVKAKIDRATNTITVEGEGVNKISLYFNDVLVDMDKPVKVVCNGTETNATVPPLLPSTLNYANKGRSDPGKVYVASRQFDLPPKPIKPEKDKPVKPK